MARLLAVKAPAQGWRLVRQPDLDGDGQACKNVPQAWALAVSELCQIYRGRLRMVVNLREIFVVLSPVSDTRTMA